MNDINFFKKNGYLLKKNLINQETINKINKIVNEVVSKEKNKKKVVNKTQSYNNYHFVYNSDSKKNREILRLNNPQNRHKIFYDLSRNKKIISIAKKLLGGSVRFHLGKLNFKLPNKKNHPCVEFKIKKSHWGGYKYYVGTILRSILKDNHGLCLYSHTYDGYAHIEHKELKKSFLSVCKKMFNNKEIKQLMRNVA